MVSLKEVIETLGYPLLQVLTAPKGTDVEVTGINVHDPQDPMDVVPGQLVLAVGFAPGREASTLLSVLSAAGAAALIIKASLGAERLAAEADLAVLTVPPGTAWSQLILLLSSVLSRLSFGASAERLAGVEAGDLFAVANVVAELVDAPITIEDPQSRVLAFSMRQEEADSARAETILGRQVPTAWHARLQEMGVFQRLVKERQPIYIQDIAPEVMPRVAIAVRAGDEVLGSIWAAVKKPLPAVREQEMVQAANFVALHLLRHRLASDAESGLEAELVSTVLKGGPLAADAGHRLSLFGKAFRVLVVGSRRPDGELEQFLGRLRYLIGMHLSTPNRRAVSAAVGGLVYVIAPVSSPANLSLSDIRAAAERLWERASAHLGLPLLIAIGASVDGIEGIPSSRMTADQAFRVLRTHGGASVAEIGDVRSRALLLRFADVCASDPSLTSGPIERLRSYDTEHKTAYVPTLGAYLDSFGDAEEAARRLEVHPNTIRYRLRQLQSVLNVNLQDPAQRLVLMLELQLAD